MTELQSDDNEEPPWHEGWEKKSRAALQAAGGVIPFAGGLFSAAAGYWSEREQQRVNDFLGSWIKMLEDELREKQGTVAEIVSRLDVQDETIAERVKSSEYQSLVKKAFRNWAGAESEKKREYVRNILSNAAATDLTSDDVISLFIEWLQTYSEFHFAVIAEIYQRPGSTRWAIWQNLDKATPREDSAESDLYKLLIRDLSTGGVIRQARETDMDGQFIAKKRTVKRPRGSNSRYLKSAFDNEEQYHLTALGQQFVHYAMTDIPIKIEYQRPEENEDA